MRNELKNAEVKSLTCGYSFMTSDGAVSETRAGGIGCKLSAGAVVETQVCFWCCGQLISAAQQRMLCASAVPVTRHPRTAGSIIADATMTAKILCPNICR